MGCAQTGKLDSSWNNNSWWYAAMVLLACSINEYSVPLLL